jgi:hypothetical protein
MPQIHHLLLTLPIDFYVPVILQPAHTTVHTVLLPLCCPVLFVSGMLLLVWAFVPEV